MVVNYLRWPLVWVCWVACTKQTATHDRVDRTRVVTKPAVNSAQTSAFATAPQADRTMPYGLVTGFLAQIFEKPTTLSRVVGYMRRGTKFRLTEAQPVARTQSCGHGWYPVSGGGYVCSQRGYAIEATPPALEGMPTAASLEKIMPYAYGKVAQRDVPQFALLPTREEQKFADEIMQQLRAQEAKTSRAQSAESETSLADSVEAQAPPGLNVESDKALPASGSISMDAGVETALPPFLKMRMQPGFYVTLDRLEVTEEDERFYRTIRGGYVSADAMTEVTPPAMRGVVLGVEWKLPLAFVFYHSTAAFRSKKPGVWKADGVIEKHVPIVITEELERDGKRWIVGADGRSVKISSVRIARLTKRPPLVPKGQRWIHIQLSEQTLVAYEGDVPLFATLISSGKDEHKTPTGIFQIQSKHISATMDDNTTPESTYSIEDVPWTMYFHGNFALHGAFWHNSFGLVRSHGCVNLSPIDARWLFQWTEPKLPSGWHGYFVEPGHAGTWVVIEP